jgi:NAD(P)-dependent dehydrogenase (short-subunit alcohol dehydrogenase family)
MLAQPTHSEGPAETDPPRAPDPDLSGQVAVVSGGAGVIGRAIAARLVSVNAKVVIGDVDGEAAAEVAASLGDRTIAIGRRIDVRSPDDAKALVAAAAELFGRLDILINAAGIIHVNPLLDIPQEVWRNVFAVNVEGPLLCLQAAAKVMAAQPIDPVTQCRGKIINVSSQGAEFPIPTSAAYGASKRALNYLTEMAAAGMVYQGMWRSVNLERSSFRGEDFDDRIRLDLAETPTGRFQDPVALADIVLFVAAYRGLDLNGKTVWSEAHVA